MLVTTTAKVSFLKNPPRLTATLTLEGGKTEKVELKNPKWEKAFALEELDGKTFKLQGEIEDGVFTIKRMKRAAFTPR